MVETGWSVVAVESGWAVVVVETGCAAADDDVGVERASASLTVDVDVDAASGVKRKPELLRASDRRPPSAANVPAVSVFSEALTKPPSGSFSSPSLVSRRANPTMMITTLSSTAEIVCRC